MSRCPDCRRVLIRGGVPEGGFIPIRTWSSGPELIRLSETGCDLCSFIKRFLEKSSTANRRHLRDKPAIMLRDCYHEIVLSHYRVPGIYWVILRFDERPHGDSYGLGVEFDAVHALFPIPGSLCDPVLHACEFFESCVLDDNGIHRNCGRAKTGISTTVGTLPHRLLDLSHGNCILTLDVQTWVRTGRATVDQLSDYCTLTYRWGNGPPDCMLRTQFSEDRTSSLESLPQTFKDAIIISRALKIRFLWIDAMCIIQPSAHGDFTDWNAEGPRMWLVYQNAICNIAATCSSDPNDGFLSRVGTDYTASCIIPQETEDGGIQPIFLKSDADAFEASVVISSLNRRGWVAQERLLSRRILHFTEERVFWECQADNGNDYLFAQGIDWDYVQNPSLLTLKQWLRFIKFYSKSSFTQPADRLIALSSIARSVQVEVFGTTYFAGIWKEHLVHCLSWLSDVPSPRHLRRTHLAMAPSWSWASVPGGIAYPHHDVYEIAQSLVELQGTSMSLAQANNSYGNVERGELKLLARMWSMSLPTDNRTERLFEGSDIEILDRVHIYGTIHWDETQDVGVTKSVYDVVPFLTTSDVGRSGYILALIVTLLSSTADENIEITCGVYRRIGRLELAINWKVDENTNYKRPRLDVLFDAVAKDSTKRSIVIM
ncbi:hypothetical protein IG631_11247 [Alternaria alternata]|nr:hypothetical protein IG631_11247 [Alternaria alternata]